MELNESELLALDGRCRPEVQDFIDEVKWRDSMLIPAKLGLLSNEELAEWPHSQRVRDVLLERAQGGDDEARSILDNPRREEPTREALEVRAQAWRMVARSHERELRVLKERVYCLEAEQTKLSQEVGKVRADLAEWIDEAS